MQEAIRMVTENWGPEHPWVLEFRNVLEDWLRANSREDDAKVLQAEAEVLIGMDEDV